MKIQQVITLSYEADNGATGFFSCALDLGSPTSPYQQVKAAMRNAGFAEPPPDDLAFEAVINQQYGSEANSDRSAVTFAQIAALLDRINTRQEQIDSRRTAIAADITLLPSATATQQRAIVGRLLTGEENTLSAEKQELDVLAKLVRAVSRLV